MEAVHAELVRLATGLEAVKFQVQKECNALRDLFARTTTAMSSSDPQHDRRLNHREAGRHLPQQFGGSRLDHGDYAFPMEGCAAVLSRDGQWCAVERSCRTRNTHPVWSVIDASDRLDVDMDEPVDPHGLGEEGTDTVSTGRVLAAP